MSYPGYPHPHPHSAPPPPPGPPHYWNYYRRSGGRRFSRVFWFAAGGLTAYWMMKRKNCDPASSNCESWTSGWHSNKRIEAPPKTNEQNQYWNHQQQQQQQQQQEPGFTSRWGWRSSSANANNGPTFEEAANQKQREMEKWREEKLAQAAQASAGIADMTEASLDTVIAAVEGLKTKLAESRSRRPPPPPPAANEPYPS